jgi:hypothetical protein
MGNIGTTKKLIEIIPESDPADIPEIVPEAVPEAVPGMSRRVSQAGATGFSERGEPPEWDLAVGEIIGYRWWQVVVAPCWEVNVGRLVGQVAPWNPGVNEAKCLKVTVSDYRVWPPQEVWRESFHKPPVEYPEPCGCGYWAYWSPGCSNPLGVMSPFGHSAFGVIRASGRVVIGEKGFRAEKAEILAVTFGDELRCDCPLCSLRGTYDAPSPRLAHQIMKDYDIPVLGSREQLLSEYPPDKNYGPVTGPTKPWRLPW